MCDPAVPGCVFGIFLSVICTPSSVKDILSHSNPLTTLLLKINPLIAVLFEKATLVLVPIKIHKIIRHSKVVEKATVGLLIVVCDPGLPGFSVF